MENINRRSWLRKSLGLTSGLAITPSLLDALIASPMSGAESNSFLRTVPIQVRLNANENPYGPSEKAKNAIVGILAEGNRYPFQVANDLKAMLAEHEGVSPDHIAIGAGSGELLCATGAAFGIDGAAILSPFPTFPLLMTYAEVFSARWDKVNVNENLEVDYQAMRTAIKPDTRLVFVCNPNNPTGTFVPNATVRSFCEEVSRKVTVFSDEAYLEFLDPSQQESMLGLVKQGADVIVSRTFSKIYGLAGLRIGYIVARPDTIRRISRYQTGFSVNQTAIAAARACLNDQEFMASSRNRNAEARKVLTDFLDTKGYFYGKSLTNFVFMDPKGQANHFMTSLSAKGIGIRTWDFNGKQWNRISVGTVEEMKSLVKILSEIA